MEYHCVYAIGTTYITISPNVRLHVRNTTCNPYNSECTIWFEYETQQGIHTTYLASEYPDRVIKVNVDDIEYEISNCAFNTTTHIFTFTTKRIYDEV